VIKTLLVSATLIFGIISFLSCNKEEEETAPVVTAPDSLLLGIAGAPINMEYSHVANNSPYTLDQKVTFTFTVDGSMSIDTDLNGKANVLVSTYTKSGVVFIWTDTIGGYSYSLLFNTDGTVSAVNVSDIRVSTFVGQFTPI